MPDRRALTHSTPPQRGSGSTPRRAVPFMAGVVEGLTLIEILLVLSLVSIISIALYKALRNGLQVWERSRYLVVEEDIAIFFDKITQDIKNSYFIQRLDLKGRKRIFLSGR